MTTEYQKLRTILLVDDDSDDREFFEDALTAVTGDIELKLAENGQEALELLRNEPDCPGLIFLDLNMPVKDGFECLRDLKKNEQLKNIPVIIFSTSLQPDTADAAYSGGANLYIVKPNSFPALNGILAKVLSLPWQPPPIPSRETFIYHV